MPMNTRRFVFTMTAAAGGLLAALSFSTATARADDWAIGPADGFAAPVL
jgi:hypothetical protein